MMSANNSLSHDPQPPWPCWTQAGHDGAATSNLALGNTGPAGDRPAHVRQTSTWGIVATCSTRRSR